MIDAFWCQLRDEAQSHPSLCKDALCGRYVHVDGNCKVIRDCCHFKDQELYVTAIGRVVKGCPNTPLRGKKYCADHIQQAAASGAEPEPGAQDGEERDVTDEEDAGSEEEDEEDQEAGIEQPIGSRTRQGTKMIGKGKKRVEETGQEVSERWDVDSAPISVRTRLKRKVLQKEQLYEAEKIVASKKKNGVSLLIIHVFWSNRNFFTRRGPCAGASACIVH